ncbi:Eukaryotic translation initiation factor 3 subunit J-B [Apodemus speciosus]|uniref:Eukaryotic translation initiation factor 3 subunit J-B n=1 Tax=Apodemus speciosus TaxID=105296 RepID=A0ABQ0EJ62_APOSI
MEDPVRKVAGGGTAGGDRWEGEDEDEDVKQVFLRGPGCPGTHSVDQAGLELRNPPASASQVLGLQGVRHHTRLHLGLYRVSLYSPGCPGTHSVDRCGDWPRTQKSACLCLPECWDYRHEPPPPELDNWDDDDDEGKEEAEVKPEIKISEKKKIAEKIKEKERQQKKRQEEIKKRLEEPEESKVLTPEEQLADKLRLKKLQEESDLELAKETFGVNNTVNGIDAMNPSSRDDFTEFGKLLKDKITQYEKSLYYASFLEALVRDVCISLVSPHSPGCPGTHSVDLKLRNLPASASQVLGLKQEKQSKAKKKKKGVVPGGGLKATMKDDLADYGGYDGGYVQDYEDFM